MLIRKQPPASCAGAYGRGAATSPEIGKKTRKLFVPGTKQPPVGPLHRNVIHITPIDSFAGSKPLKPFMIFLF